MNIIKRIKYLWKLSRNCLSYEEQVALHYKDIGFKPEEKSRMAQIIKMKDEEKIINELLNEK